MSMRASQRLLKLQESPESFVDNEYMHQIIAELLINSDLTHPSLLLICSLGGEELSSSCTQKKKQVRKLHWELEVYEKVHQVEQTGMN